MKIGAFPVHNPPKKYTKFEKKQTKTVGCSLRTKCILAVADSTTQAQNQSIPDFVRGYKYILRKPTLRAMTIKRSD
jgi:hypothetical protein